MLILHFCVSFMILKLYFSDRIFHNHSQFRCIPLVTHTSHIKLITFFSKIANPNYNTHIPYLKMFRLVLSSNAHCTIKQFFSNCNHSPIIVHSQIIIRDIINSTHNLLVSAVIILCNSYMYAVKRITITTVFLTQQTYIYLYHLLMP